MKKRIFQDLIPVSPGSTVMGVLKVFTATISLAVVAGCAGFVPAADFPIRDSGLYASSNVAIYWLNDEEVLFGGPTGETRRRPDGVDEPVNRVSVWNIRTNQVRRYSEVAAQLCYYEGYIVFWQHDVPSRRLWVNYGKLGAEKREERGTLKPGEYYDTYTCRHHSELPSLPDWTKGLGIRRLIPEHGFLINEYSFRNTPYSFCSPKAEQSQCVPMPIKRREIMGFRWYPFKQAYFAVGHYFRVVPNHPDGGFGESPWPKDLPMPVWWMYPDGRTEEIKLPAGPWLRTFVFPTRSGMVTIGEGPSAFEQTLYLVNDGGGIPLLHGLFQGSHLGHFVSPDGCKIAVNHDPKPLQTTARNFKHVTLKVIDFCKGEQRGIQHR